MAFVRFIARPPLYPSSLLMALPGPGIPVDLFGQQVAPCSAADSTALEQQSAVSSAAQQFAHRVPGQLVGVFEHFHKPLLLPLVQGWRLKGQLKLLQCSLEVREPLLAADVQIANGTRLRALTLEAQL